MSVDFVNNKNIISKDFISISKFSFCLDILLIFRFRFNSNKILKLAFSIIVLNSGFFSLDFSLLKNSIYCISFSISFFKEINIVSAPIS